MAVAVNAVLLVVAIGFMALAYTTNGAAGSLPGDARPGAPRGPSLRLIYRLSVALGPITLALLSAHLGLTAVLQSGPDVTLLFMLVAVLLLFAALSLMVQVWRHA